MKNSKEIEDIVKEDQYLKEENERLKNAFFIPKIVNNVFDYFIWFNLHISNTIENFEEKQ